MSISADVEGYLQGRRGALTDGVAGLRKSIVGSPADIQSRAGSFLEQGQEKARTARESLDIESCRLGAVRQILALAGSSAELRDAALQFGRNAQGRLQSALTRQLGAVLAGVIQGKSLDELKGLLADEAART